jgi:non-specific protein-tyrosine kinase
LHLYSSQRNTDSGNIILADGSPGSDVAAGIFGSEALLRDLILVLWRRLWLIVFVAVGLSGAVVGFSFAQTPTYEASVKLLVGQESGTGRGDALPYDAYQLQQATVTMAETVETRPVAEAVIRQLNLHMTPNDLLEHTGAQQLTATQLIQVDYSSFSPEKAKHIANAIGEEFSAQIAKVSEDVNAITVTVWERAALPTEPVSPNPVRNGLLGLVAGLILGIGLAFLLEQLDDSWRSLEEVEQVSGVPTLAAIPELNALKDKKGSD